MATNLIYQETFHLPEEYSLTVEIIVSNKDLSGNKLKEEILNQAYQEVDTILFDYIKKNNLNIEHFMLGREYVKFLAKLIEEKLNRKVTKISCTDEISNTRNCVNIK